MDLYFRVNQGVTFSVSGPSEVHLCGYWEPTEDLLGEGGDPYGGFDEEDSEDEIDEEELQALRKAKQNTKKNENIPVDDSDDDSDEELKQTAKKVQ